jgi:hypothetical protein
MNTWSYAFSPHTSSWRVVLLSIGTSTFKMFKLYFFPRVKNSSPVGPNGQEHPWHCLRCLRQYFFSEMTNYHCSTEHRGRVVNTPAWNSEGPGFISRPGDWLPWLRFFVVFLSPPGEFRDSALD